MAKRTKFICTIGPSVDDKEMIRALIENGMDVARLNFSHGSHEEHAARIEVIKRAREVLDTPTAIMLDTKGPEIRTGLLADHKPVSLQKGAPFILTTEEVEGTDLRVSQTAGELPGCVKPGDTILLDDGLIALEVDDINGADILCTVKNSGMLGERKSVNVPGVAVPLPAVTDKDRADLLFGIEQDIDYVAASFIRNAAGVREIREFLKAHGGAGIRIVSKIENAEAVENIEEIVKASDGIMVARGDLGVEVPEYKVPHIQKSIIRLCNRASKPVITATQMLDSMIRNPRPTRAEVADVANAIYDGTDCVMLSGETASGAYPLEALQTMVQIAHETEPLIYEEHPPRRDRDNARVSLAVGQAAVSTAETIDAACIIAPTMSGRTARLMSNLRPRMPIYAVTPFPKIRRQMQLSWGVTPLLGEVQGNMRHVVTSATEAVKEVGAVAPGDLAVVTAGDPNTSVTEDITSPFHGTTPTNVMYVVQIH